MNHQSTTNPLMSDTDIEMGEKKEHISRIQNTFAYHNNVRTASIKIRMAFIRKVYGLLSMQLLMTVVIAATFCLVEPVKEYVLKNSWPAMTAMFSTFIIIIALFAKRKEHPINLILLSTFTIIEACSIGILVSLFDAFVVLEAFFITLTVVISLTAFTFQTKRDFSAMSASLFTGLWVLIIGGLLQIFIQSSLMEIFLCIGGAILFSVFIIFDTQMIMEHLSPEEYILATINIYLDIINLFLYILRALAIFRE